MFHITRWHLQFCSLLFQIGLQISLFLNFSSHLGSYVFIESSSTSSSSSGDSAWLTSEMFSATRGRCIEFWYHMKGSDIGTLNVYAVNQNQTATSMKTPIWTLSGEQGTKWLYAQAPIVQKLSYYVSSLFSDNTQYLFANS